MAVEQAPLAGGGFIRREAQPWHPGWLHTLPRVSESDCSCSPHSFVPIWWKGHSSARHSVRQQQQQKSFQAIRCAAFGRSVLLFFTPSFHHLCSPLSHAPNHPG